MAIIPEAVRGKYRIEYQVYSPGVPLLLANFFDFEAVDDNEADFLVRSGGVRQHIQYREIDIYQKQGGRIILRRLLRMESIKIYDDEGSENG